MPFHLGLVGDAQRRERDAPMLTATAFNANRNTVTSAGRQDRQRLSRARAWVTADRARADLLGLNTLGDRGWTLMLTL